MFWAVIQIYESKLSVQERGEFGRKLLCVADIPRWERVIVEGDAVDDRDEEQGPVGTGLGGSGVVAVGYGEEDVSYV